VFKRFYWQQFFYTRWFRDEYGKFPIDLVQFKKSISHIEKDFDRFIPWIYSALVDDYDITIENIFILDENVKKSSEIKVVTDFHNTQISYILKNQGSPVHKNTSFIE